MKLLSSYIIKNVVAAIFFITLILMGIEVFFVFIGELGNIGTGNYGVLAALKYVLLDMPYQLNILFPMAGLVGSLIGLGQLAGHSELIVMRASGYSTLEISLDVLKAAAIALIFATFIGEVIAPHAESLAQTEKAAAKSGGQAFVTQNGVWLRQQQSFIQIDSIASSTQLNGVTVYQLDQKQNLVAVMQAQSAQKQAKGWILNQVNISRFVDQTVQTSNVPTMPWNVHISQHLLNISQSDPRNMSLKQLGEYITYLKQNGLQATSYQLSFWRRILQPLTTGAMIFLSVPFILGPLRTVPMGVRILSGIAVGFIFYILNQFFSPLTTLYQIPAFISAFLPIILFSGLAYWLLKRVR